MVVGAFPNDFIPVNSLYKDKIFERLKYCNKVKHGPMAKKFKVVVVSFQTKPKGIPPFLTLADQ